MATAKKATKKVATTKVAAAATATPATPTRPAADPVRQAAIVMAHATVAQLGLAIGDRVTTHDFIQNGEEETRTYRGQAIPYGFSSTDYSATRRVYGENCVFRGINADGKAMVCLGRTDYAVPASFLLVNEEHGRPQLRLNESYTGTVLGDGSTVAVGCQRFKTAKLREFLGLVDKTLTERAARKTRAAQGVNTATPAATYVPTPAVVAKKAAKKAVRKS